MNLVFTMKMLSDICFYFAFANFITYLFGGHNGIMTIPIMTALTFFSAYLKDKGVLKYFPLVLMVFCFFVVPFNIANIILLLPPIIYIIYNVYNLKNFNYNFKYSDTFFLFIKIAAPFMLIFLFYFYENIEKNSLPFAMIFLVNSVALMRILRQDISVLKETRFKIVTILPICIALLVSFILSSTTFFNLCKSILGTIYLKIIIPILMLIVTAVSYLGNSLLNFLKSIFKYEPTVDLGQPSFDTEEFADYFNSIPQEESQGAKIIIIIIIITLIIFVMITLFRRLTRLERLYSVNKGVVEERVSIDINAKSSKRNKKLNKIRVIYRNFLLLCKKSGLPIKKSMTSKDYENLSIEKFDNPEILKEIRSIYINARYDEKTIENKEYVYFKKLYANLIKNINKK